MLNKLFVLTGMLIVGLSIPAHLDAVEITRLPYPRTANLYLAPGIHDDQARILAKWDVVVLSAAVQDVSPNAIRVLRRENPDIVILAYFPSNEMPVERLDEYDGEDGPFHKIFRGISDNWWLENTDGEILSQWPGNQTLNVTNLSPKDRNNERWNTYFPIASIDMSWQRVFGMESFMTACGTRSRHFFRMNSST